MCDGKRSTANRVCNHPIQRIKNENNEKIQYRRRHCIQFVLRIIKFSLDYLFWTETQKIEASSVAIYSDKSYLLVKDMGLVSHSPAIRVFFIDSLHQIQRAISEMWIQKTKIKEFYFNKKQKWIKYCITEFFQQL